MAAAFRRSEIDELIDVVHNAGFTHDLQRYDAAAQRSQGKTVRASIAVYVIRRFPSTAAVHELKDDRRIAGDVLAQEWNQRPNAKISRSARGPSDDYFHCLPLIERSLREGGRECHGQHSASRHHKRYKEKWPPGATRVDTADCLGDIAN